MSDNIKKPSWYVRLGLECYDVIRFMVHKLKPIEAVHMANHVKYSARFLEKHDDILLQKQDLDKANETWKSFYEEASKRFEKPTPIYPEELMVSGLDDED